MKESTWLEPDFEPKNHGTYKVRVVRTLTYEIEVVCDSEEDAEVDAVNEIEKYSNVINLLDEEVEAVEITYMGPVEDDDCDIC